VKPPKHRSGVTLLITLSIIASMMALVGLLFGYVDQARQKAEFRRALIQADLLRADLGEILRRTLGKKPSIKTLELVYSTPLILQTRQAPFGVNAHCRPLLNRLRIGWLRSSENSTPRQKLARRIFERLCERAELKNANYLLELIQKSLKGEEVRFGSGDNLQKKEGIITQKEFLRLLDDYRFAQDDDRVYRIRWSRYFTFDDTPLYPKLDGEFAPPELLSLILDLDPGVIREGMSPGGLRDFLATTGLESGSFGWLFAKGSVPAMECRVTFRFQEGSQSFRFNYIAQRIEDLEIASE